MLWFCAPPSDQEENSQMFGNVPWGDVAWTELRELTMTVWVKGVV
jgi:hypothetical protein